MWYDLTNDTDRWYIYLNILRASGTHYDSITAGELTRLVTDKQGQLFLFQEDDKLIALGFKFTQTLNQWRILHCIPYGFTAEQVANAMQIAFRKIRKVMDSVGAISFYADRLSVYPTPEVQLFLDAVPKIAWELAEVKEDGGMLNWQFYRDPARVDEDERWQGSQQGVT